MLPPSLTANMHSSHLLADEVPTDTGWESLRPQNTPFPTRPIGHNRRALRTKRLEADAALSITCCNFEVHSGHTVLAREPSCKWALSLGFRRTRQGCVGLKGWVQCDRGRAFGGGGAIFFGSVCVMKKNNFSFAIVLCTKPLGTKTPFPTKLEVGDVGQHSSCCQGLQEAQRILSNQAIIFGKERAARWEHVKQTEA